MASSNSNSNSKSLPTFPIPDLKSSANQSSHRSRNNSASNIPDKKLAFSDSPTHKSKTKIRIRIKTSKPAQQVDPAAEPAKDLDHQEESIAKTWKLRPRRRRLVRGPRPNDKLSVPIPDDTKPNLPQSACPKATNDAVLTDKQKKPNKTNFSIPLTNLEIEEDILAITGSKPSRKPGKRARHVQKQLDQLFPGMWLSSVTPDVYKVHDSPEKL